MRGIRMDAQLIGQVALVACALIGAVVPLLGRRAARRTLRSDLRTNIELLNELPADSPSTRKLAALVDRTIDLLADEQERRRDPGGIGVGLGLGLIVLSTLAGLWAIDEGGRWLWVLVPAGFFLLIGSLGLTQDITRGRSDKRAKQLDQS
ncbi:hypothetical protein [Flindersiella endophytica]